MQWDGLEIERKGLPYKGRPQRLDEEVLVVQTERSEQRNGCMHVIVRSD